MARVGLLMLNDGNWNGDTLIPADWVELTTNIFTPTSQFNPEFQREWISMHPWQSCANIMHSNNDGMQTFAFIVRS
jgi:CubicO group peptidase (beta-lactamase class C family)